MIVAKIEKKCKNIENMLRFGEGHSISQKTKFQ
jgi:hypothetical protein